MQSLSHYPFLQPFFWSYTLSELDITTHKTLIIKQILNHGDEKAVTWLRTTYQASDIANVIAISAKSEWSKKSLALWSLIYQTEPKRQGRLA